MLRAAILYLGPLSAFEAISLEASNLIRVSAPANDPGPSPARLPEAVRRPANAFGLGMAYATLFWFVLVIVLAMASRW